MDTIGLRIVVVVLLLLSFNIKAQNFTAKVIDQQTETPVPFATVQWAENSGVITGEEGVFTIEEVNKKEIDSIHVSSLGYEKRSIALSSFVGDTIRLIPETLELGSVFLTNKNLTAYEIIDKVKENLDKNYVTDLTQNRIFYRQSDASDFEHMNIGFKKSSIAEIDQHLIDSMMSVLPNSAVYYREALCDYYGKPGKLKLNVIKAAELYDDRYDGSIEGVLNRMEGILKENVKERSYLKVKSGLLFGTKVQLDSLINLQDDSESLKEEIEHNLKGNFQRTVKYGVYKLNRELFYNDNSKLDILRKSRKYVFELQESSFFQGESVYVLSFSPKGKKDFRGIMYVNAQDFAIMRLDYENVRSLRNIRLLGLNYEESVFQGTFLFEKNTNNQYIPKYVKLEDGRRFGVKRPLKLKEKNKYVKGRRKQNEVALDIDFKNSNVITYEYFVFDNATIDTGTYQNIKENRQIKAVYLPTYDPGFWEGYAILAPHEAIRAFTSSGGN